MDYGYQYEGQSMAEMTVGDVETIVTELFPRKISLLSPQQADDVIPELLAFWKYLDREFHLPQANAVLEFLRDVEPDFPGIMNDPANFGMAKSFFTAGRDAGFDMTTKEGANAFMLVYNTALLAQQQSRRPSMPTSSLFPPSHRLDPAVRKTVPAAKKPDPAKRKAASAASKVDPAVRRVEKSAEAGRTSTKTESQAEVRGDPKDCKTGCRAIARQ